MTIKLDIRNICFKIKLTNVLFVNKTRVKLLLSLVINKSFLFYKIIIQKNFTNIIIILLYKLNQQCNTIKCTFT